jgi:hypothetical protein
MALNDHWLKGADLLPAAVTGKLSDLCGLFFFPALVVALARGLGRLVNRRPRQWLIPAAVLLTGTGFVAANISVSFNHWLAGWWIHKVMDPSDLVALPILLASWLWLLSRERSAHEQG